MKVLKNNLVFPLKRILINEEKYHEITLRIEITRFIYWQLHVLIALSLIAYYQILKALSHILDRELAPTKSDKSFFSKKLTDQITDGCWKYSLAQIMFKVEESYYYRNLEINSPSLEIGTGDCTTSNIFFNGKQIDIASDITWHYHIFPEASRKIYKHFVTFDTYQIPFKNSYFQDVLMVHIADHLPSFDTCLDEVNRVLKTGGNFYFSGFSDHWRRLLGWGQRNDMPCFSGKHYNLYNHDEWEGILKAKGLQLIDHGYFISGNMARFFRLTLFLYHARRDGLRVFEKWPPLDKWYTEMISNLFIPMCEKNLWKCKEQDAGIHFWVHARKTKDETH